MELDAKESFFQFIKRACRLNKKGQIYFLARRPDKRSAIRHETIVQPTTLDDAMANSAYDYAGYTFLLVPISLGSTLLEAPA